MDKEWVVHIVCIHWRWWVSLNDMVEGFTVLLRVTWHLKFMDYLFVQFIIFYFWHRNFYWLFLEFHHFLLFYFHFLLSIFLLPLPTDCGYWKPWKPQTVEHYSYSRKEKTILFVRAWWTWDITTSEVIYSYWIVAVPTGTSKVHLEIYHDLVRGRWLVVSLHLTFMFLGKFLFTEGAVSLSQEMWSGW